MTAYLLAFRSPADGSPPDGSPGRHLLGPRSPGPAMFEAWAEWQLKLGARLRDRGNPAFSAMSLGASVADTRLGGYSLIRAVSLDEAADLARGCPALGYGGAVEVAELTPHDDMYDEWLGRHA